MSTTEELDALRESVAKARGLVVGVSCGNCLDGCIRDECDQMSVCRECGGTGESCPDYPRDPASAFGLLCEMWRGQTEVSLMQQGTGFTVMVTPYDGECVCDYGETREAAICSAWLSWKEAGK